MGNFDDLSMAVASFGGNNRVIFDDLEKPSIMVGIPKMKYSDLITGGTQDTLDVFKVNGVERDMLYISKYINVVVNDRAYSLPMKDPATSIDFDTAIAVCRRKGAGWGLTPNGLWGAIMLWCNRNNFLPRGNTYNSRSFEKPYEMGVNTYVNYNGGGRTATGSGPVTWYHDGSPAGIADMCGNVSEWVAGLRIVGSEIQIIPYGNCMRDDCDMSAESTEWKAIKPDGAFVNPGTAGTLHYNLTNGKISIGVGTNTAMTAKQIAFSELAAASSITVPQIVKALGLIKDSADIYPATGHNLYLNTDNNERIPTRGGNYGSGGTGGLGMLMFSLTRSAASGSFRSVYDEKLATENR